MERTISDSDTIEWTSPSAHLPSEEGEYLIRYTKLVDLEDGEGVKPITAIESARYEGGVFYPGESDKERLPATIDGWAPPLMVDPEMEDWSHHLPGSGWNKERDKYVLHRPFEVNHEDLEEGEVRIEASLDRGVFEMEMILTNRFGQLTIDRYEGKDPQAVFKRLFERAGMFLKSAAHRSQSADDFFEVVMEDLDPDSKIQLIKLFRRERDWGLRKSKEEVENPPSTAGKNLPLDEAEELKEELEDLGADAKIV